jgi:hypothetical protein
LASGVRSSDRAGRELRRPEEIGAKGSLTRPWLATSPAADQLDPAAWLTREQGRRGIENRTPHTLDVTHRQDESRVHHPNAASVADLFRRLANACKHVWAQGRPKRQATARDRTEENLCNRWLGVRRFTRSSVARFSPSKTPPHPSRSSFY